MHLVAATTVQFCCVCVCVPACSQINGQSLAHVTHQVAVEAFRKATEKVVLVVESGAEARIKV